MFTGNTNSDEFRAKVAIRWQAAWVRMKWLEMASHDAFLRREKVRFCIAEMANSSFGHIFCHQVGKNPSNTLKSKLGSHTVDNRLPVVRKQQANRITCRFLKINPLHQITFSTCFGCEYLTYLWRLINCCDYSFDSKWHIQMNVKSGRIEHFSLILEK